MVRNIGVGSDVAIKWLGLSIKGAQEISSNSAEVEFIARYKIGGAKTERYPEIKFAETRKSLKHTS